MIGAISTFAGIIGAIFVMIGNPTAANTVWLFSNPLLIYHNYTTGDMHQAAMFGFFFIAALIGVYLAFRNKRMNKAEVSA